MALKHLSNLYSKSSAVSSVIINRILRYFLIIKRYKKVLLAIFAVCLLGSIIWVIQKPPTYISRSRMIVSAKLTLDKEGGYNEELSNFFGTQLEIMHSPHVQEKARARVLTLYPSLKGNKVRLSAKQIMSTSIFDLQAVGTNDLYVTEFLNALMEEFISFKKEFRQETSFVTIAQITNELGRLRKEQEEQQETLLKFKKKYNITYWEAQSSESAKYLSELKNKESQLLAQLRYLESLNLGEDMEGASQEMLTAAADLMLMSPTGWKTTYIPFSEAFKSEYLEGKKQLLKYEVELEELMNTLNLSHPKIAMLRDSIQIQQNFLNVLSYHNLKTAKTSIDLIYKELEITRDTIKEWEEKSLTSSHIGAEHERIMSNLEKTKGLYSNLLSTLQRLEINQNINPEMIQILQRATPAIPTRYEGVKGLLTGVLISLLMSGILLVLLDVFDYRLASPLDVKSHFDEPVLGQIPYLHLRSASTNALLNLREFRLNYLEAFRNLRSSLIFNQNKQSLKTLLLTGALPSEGKTTVAINLGITLAQSGERVLLIDADLRLAQLSHLFHLESKPGLGDILENRIDWESCIEKTVYPNISILPRGKVESTAGDLFLSPTLNTLMDRIKPQFDRILFDSAPILAVTDTACLAPKVDGVLLVLKSGYTPLAKFEQALHNLQFRQANVLGFIINALRFFPCEHSYYGYKQYQQKNSESLSKAKVSKPA